MVSVGSYILSVALLALLVGSLGFAAVRLRRRLLPEWEGAPARLVEGVVAVALLIWLAELLGVVGLLYAGTLVAAAVVMACVARFLPAGGVAGGTAPEEALATGGGGGSPAATGPAGWTAWSFAIAVAVVAAVFADWGLTAVDALNRGIFNFDSLWYHQPFAVEMAKSHSVTGLHYTETVFTNWFYPQNSELLHAVGILITERDTLSLFINFGWLGMAFLAAWCIGRPWGRGDLSVVAVAILLSSHTLVVREPGAAKNDVMAAALLLAAIAILISAWARGRSASPAGGVVGGTAPEDALATGRGGGSPAATGPAGHNASSLAWSLAAAGLATGLAVGTKSTALAMAAALTLAVVALAPAGRRWAAVGWWSIAAFAGGGYWYVRNLIASGNPLPQLESLGPISLPHPERLQSGRPDFSVAHYATDTSVWTEYFGPELNEAFGLLWPLVLLAAIAGGLVALVWGRERVLRWMGGVALFGMLAYLFTPLTAAGAEGAPEGFGINLRYAVPAMLAGLALLGAVGGSRRDGTRGLIALSLLLVVLVITDRLDAVLRDPDRLGAWAIALLFVLIPAALLFARHRGAPRAAVAGGFAALALLVAGVGYPVQRDYLDDRFANRDSDTSIPGMHLDSAYRWARDVEDSQIGLAGTTAGFLGYGFYGTDLSSEVTYLGEEGSHGAFNAIPDCRGFRAAVNDADLDYLVTAPFLNFIETDEPIRSPEAGWLRGEAAVRAIQRSGPVTIWRVRRPLDPDGCGARNAPLRYVPQQPG
ncbi:MAG TPA: hypothetical protein VFY04_11230 [Solirubrobacterales bacterium]|nr:hypothetical protein [Solirubrobacterales bacterium]